MKFSITSPFGALDAIRGFKKHSGVDINTPENTILRSIDNGVVSNVFDGNGLIGKGVAIKLPNGKNEIFGHMNQVKVHIGERVKEGQEIGLSGATGNVSGPHLHFGLQNPDGSFQDPTSLVEKVSNYAGAVPLIPDPLHVAGAIPQLFGIGGEALKESAKEATINILMGVGEALGETIAGLSLIGVGICFILKICGWRDGGRYAGVLIGINILMKFLGVKG